MDTPTPQQLRAWLEREIALGLEAIPRIVAFPATPVAARAIPASVPVAMRVAEAPASFGTGSALSEVLVEPAIREAASLEALREVIGDCRR